MVGYRELSSLMEKTVHKYSQLEKVKRTYASDVLLTQAEIHTIVAVGDNPAINVTGLAKVQGITKGAASQMVYKLVAKGFVKKETSPSSDSEVVLTLTSEGQREKDAHDAFHASTNNYFFKLLRDLPEETVDQMAGFLEAFDTALDDRLETLSK